MRKQTLTLLHSVIIMLIMAAHSPILAQDSIIHSKYYEYTDSNRIVLLEQKVKNNMIDVSGVQQPAEVLRSPVFVKRDEKKLLKFPLDTAKGFEIELEVTLDTSDNKKGVVEIWGAIRKNINEPRRDSEKEIIYQQDMWSDGIYNILQRVYDEILLGVKGIKKIRVDDEPNKRLITIRKIDEELEFFMNKNLVLAILPPGPINEIGLNIKNEGVEINSIRIVYLSKYKKKKKGK